MLPLKNQDAIIISFSENSICVWGGSNDGVGVLIGCYFRVAVLEIMKDTSSIAEKAMNQLQMERGIC